MASTHQNSHQTGIVSCVGCGQPNGDPVPAERVIVHFDQYGDMEEWWPYCVDCANGRIEDGSREYPLDAFYECGDHPPVRQIYEDERTIQIYTDGPERDTIDPDKPTEWIEAKADGRLTREGYDSFVHDLNNHA